MQVFWRGLLGVLVWFAATQAAVASEIKKLGVMSVLGKELQIVTYTPTTGSRVDRNLRDSLKLAPGDIENYVLRASAESASRAGLSEPMLLGRPANGSTPWQRDAKGVLVTRSLLDAANAAKLSHLLLIQPARADANLRMADTATGSGQLEGIGFYIDSLLQVEQEGTRRPGTGFLAPFAYFDMLLVEVASLDLQAVHRARASIAVNEPGESNPWEAMSSQRKIEVLRELIQSEVDKAFQDWTRPRTEAPPAR